MGQEEKRNKVFNDLVIELYAVEPREMYILGLALEYADMDSYVEEPKNFKEQCINDIFRVKAKSYYRRKLIEYKRRTPDMCKILTQIKECEQNDVMRIKMQFLPAIKLQK